MDFREAVLDYLVCENALTYAVLGIRCAVCLMYICFMHVCSCVLKHIHGRTHLLHSFSEVSSKPTVNGARMRLESIGT